MEEVCTHTEIFHLLIHPQVATMARPGTDSGRSQEFHLYLPYGRQRAKYLDHLLLLS